MRFSFPPLNDFSFPKFSPKVPGKIFKPLYNIGSRKHSFEERNMAVEKRWAPRSKFNRKVEVLDQKASTGSLKADVCYSQDISKGGINLETSHGYKPNSILKLNLQLFEKKPVNVFAKVVWRKENRCGLKFMAFDQKR